MNATKNDGRKLFTKMAMAGLLLAAVMANGCASTPDTDTGGSKSASNLASDLAMPAPGKSKVVFLRPGTYAWPYHFGMHDGERLVGKSSSSSYFVYECDPGHHVFSTSMENMAFLDADLLPDRIYYVRVKAGMGMWTARVNMYALYPGCAEINWRKLPRILGDLEKEHITEVDAQHDAEGITCYMDRLKKYQDEAKPGANKILPEYGQTTPLPLQ
jgi:hypothetical protein